MLPPMAPNPRKTTNPFFVLLIFDGIAFALTACSYFVMTITATMRPEEAARAMESGRGLLALMDRHGLTIMLVELAILAAATVAAIGTDKFWTRRAARQKEEGSS